MLPVGSGLEGERIRLRPLELADADTVRGWVNDPEVMRCLGVADRHCRATQPAS